MLLCPEPLGAPFQRDLIPSIVCEGRHDCTWAEPSEYTELFQELSIVAHHQCEVHMAIQMVDDPTTYSYFRARFFGPVFPRLSSAGHRDGGVGAEFHWGGEVLSAPALGRE